MVAHHPEYMSFAEFQSTRKKYADLSNAINDTNVTGAGYTYLKDQLFIEEMPIEILDTKYQTRIYYLMLHREQTMSDDLFALERKMYDWAVSECYITDLEGTECHCLSSEQFKLVDTFVKGRFNCTSETAIFTMKNEEMKTWYLQIEVLESHANIITSQALSKLLLDLRMNKIIDETAEQMWVGKSSRGNMLVWCVGGSLPEVKIAGKAQYTLSVHDADGKLISTTQFQA